MDQASIELPYSGTDDPITWAAGFNVGSTILGRDSDTGVPLIRFSGHAFDVAHLRYAHAGGTNMARDLVAVIESLASSPTPDVDLDQIYAQAFGAGGPDSTVSAVDRVVALAIQGSTISALTLMLH